MDCYSQMNAKEMISALMEIRKECIRLIRDKSPMRLSKVIPLSYYKIGEFQAGRNPNPPFEMMQKILEWKLQGSVYVEGERSSVKKKKPQKTNAFPLPVPDTGISMCFDSNPTVDARIRMMMEYFLAGKILVQMEKRKPRYSCWKNLCHHEGDLKSCIRRGENLLWAPGRYVAILHVDTTKGGGESFKRLCTRTRAEIHPSIQFPGGFHVYFEGIKRASCPETNSLFPGLKMLKGTEPCLMAGSLVKKEICVWGPNKIPGVLPIVPVPEFFFELWKKGTA